MVDDDFIQNNPTAASPKTTSAFESSPEASPGFQGGEPPPFSLAKGKEGAPPTAESGQPSPMTLNAEMQANPFSPQAISSQVIQQQAAAISDQFDKSRTLLQDPALVQNNNLIKASTTDLLSQHLSRVNDNLTSLSTKLGEPLSNTYTPPGSGTQAVAHFLDYLTGGQQDLVNLTQGLQNKKLSPADLLTVQVKMSGVQQQMEFFSVLLGKAVDNIKTIMNIQS